jgi:hypothetical protein
MPRLEGVAVAPEMPRQVETTAVTVEARMAMGMAATGTDEKEMELKEEAVETCQEVWALGSAVVEAVAVAAADAAPHLEDMEAELIAAGKAAKVMEAAAEQCQVDMVTRLVAAGSGLAAMALVSAAAEAVAEAAADAVPCLVGTAGARVEAAHQAVAAVVGTVSCQVGMDMRLVAAGSNLAATATAEAAEVVEAVEAVGVVPCLVATVVATAVAAHQATAAVVG